MSDKDLHSLSGELEGLARTGMDLVTEKMADQERNVVKTFAKARKMDGNHIEPIIEVFSKSAFLDSGLQGFVGCRDHTNIHVNRHIITHPTHLPLLQDAQESALQHRGH